MAQMRNPIFLADRKDGFGSRLIAVLNAISFGEYYKSECRIVWEEKPDRGKWHTVGSIDRVFSESFIQKYAIAKNDVGSVIELEEFVALSNKGNSRKNDAQFVRMHWLLPDEMQDVVGKSFLKAALARNYKKLEFHLDLADVIAIANQLEIKPGTVAVHLRAGDVIYGLLRYNLDTGGKAVPYQLAAEFLKRCRSDGRDVIVFGQDVDLCRALASEYGATFADDLVPAQEWNSAQRELFDITVISRCETAFGGESAFLQLGAAIGERPFQTIYEAFNADERKRIILADDLPACIEHAASDEQRIYSLWTLASDLVQGADPDEAELLSIADKALVLAPNDGFLFFLRACLLVKSGALDDAEAQIAVAATNSARGAMLDITKSSGSLIRRFSDLLVPAADAGKPWASAFVVIERGVDSAKTFKYARNALADAAVSSSKWQGHILDRLQDGYRDVLSHDRAAHKELRIALKTVRQQKRKLASLKKKTNATKGKPRPSKRPSNKVQKSWSWRLMAPFRWLSKSRRSKKR
jgi:hypothetical protein